MPTFVSAHTFCASRKPWFKRYAHAGVDIDAINYATKYTAKSSLMYLYLNQKHQNRSISLTTNC